MANRIGVLAAILIMTSGSVRGTSWKPINTGLPSASLGASGLAMDPSTPSTLYSWTSGGALFKSTDGAGSWKILNGVAGLRWLVVGPRTSATLYAGTSYGPVKSTDGGASWIGANIPGADWVPSLVINPQDSNTLYAVSVGAIIKSTDGGASWKPSNTGLPGSGSPRPSSLTADPVTPSTLYAVAWDGRIFKSTDGAESWTGIKGSAFPGSFAESVLFLAIDPVTPSTIYAGSFAAATGRFDAGQGSISKSLDGGQTWRAIRAGIPADAFVRSLAIDPASPSNAYASYKLQSGWGIIKSTDAGETWNVVNSGLPSGDFLGSPIVLDPRAPSTLYTGYDDWRGARAGGILKSTNAGASWSPANAGRSFIDIRAMAIDPARPDTIYTSVGTDGVFKSVDGGASWTKLAAFQFSSGSGFSGRAYTRSLLIDFSNPNILYAGTARVDGCIYTDNLLFKSTDGGATWIDSASPRMSGCVLSGFFTGALPMVMDPTDPNTLYVGGDFDGDLGLYKSADGGASWSNPVFGCCTGNALVIDPSNPRTLYGGTPSGVGVFKSTDGGATWSRAGLNSSVNVLALDPANPSILYAATQVSESTGFAGLFKSTDSGASWFAINNGLASLLGTRSPLTALVIDPRGSNVLYASTSGYGVFRSTDGGANWSPFNDGLTNLDVRLLSLARRGSTLYAGTGSGMFAISLVPTLPFRSRR